MQKSDAAAFLAGVSQVEGSQAANPTNLHVISGEVGERSEDGKAKVAIDGLVFGEADDQYVEMDTLGGLEEGDVTTVILTGESGHAMTPLAIGAVGSVDNIRDKAEAAENAAQEAKEVAEATGQHFWPADDGIHVTEVTEEEWNDQEDATTYHQGSNILVNSYGLLLRMAESWLSQFTRGTVAFYDGLGNAAANIFAQFGRQEARIGYSNKSHMKLDYHSMSMVDKDGSTYFDVRDLRDEGGGITETESREGNGERLTFYLYRMIEPDHVTIDGVEVTDYTWGIDEDDEAYVTFTTAPANGSNIIIWFYITTDDTYKSFSMGAGAVSEGRHSYAFGRDAYTRAEDTFVIGHGSRLEEEALTDTTVVGRYNSTDDFYINNHALIIGNGTDDAHRSNAGYVDWGGEAVFGSVSAAYPVTTSDPSEVWYKASLEATSSRRGVATESDWLVWDDSNGTHVREWEPRILSQETSSSVRVDNATDRSIVTLQINEPGCWILIGHAVFNSNTTGRRVMGITTSANASLGTGASSPIIAQAPASGGATAMTVIDVVSVGWTGGLTRYLTVYQNSGGALNCQGSIKAVRVMMPA